MECKGDDLKMVTVIQTDLYLDVRHPEHDAKKVESLLQAVRRFQAENKAVDKVRIVPIRK
jgi:hypothetical protein